METGHVVQTEPRQRASATELAAPSEPLSAAALALAVFLTLAFNAVLGATLFGLAGRIDLPWIWATLALFAVGQLAGVILVCEHDPGLWHERLHPGPGVPIWDRVIIGSAGLLWLTSAGVAALDAGRLHAGDTVPAPLHAAGLVSVAAGFALVGWAMAVNTFFSRLVRIQRERGHRVVRWGPYRFVRHPGYVGWNVLQLGFALGLGSWIGLGIAALSVVLVVVRTALEDRFLRRELEGYEDYARDVRWRLVPGIW